MTSSTRARFPILSAPVSWALALAAGLPLGAFAVVVDEVRLPAGALVVVSTGLSWGTAAVLVGVLTRDRRAAAPAGIIVLATAVTVYYASNHLLGLRDSTGDALMRAAKIWIAAAVVGGSVLGVGGWYGRFGSDRQQSVAAGVVIGLLMGQGLRWALRYGIEVHPVTTTALVVPLLALAWAAHRWIAPAVIGTAAATAAASAAVWAFLDARI